MSLAEEVRTLSGQPCSFLPTTRRLPQEGRVGPSFDPEKSHYLFIGRYHQNKGPDLLLEAIHLIEPERRSKLHFHFFGVGPLERDLRRRVLEYGLNEGVTIQGPVDEYGLAALLKQSCALIIPSRIESIPVILSDALQVGCDLIVTPGGEMGPLVQSYGAGIMVETVSPEALKEAILNHVERRSNDFEKGRQELYALFDLKKSAETFLRRVGSGG